MNVLAAIGGAFCGYLVFALTAVALFMAPSALLAPRPLGRSRAA